ncbi:MAG: SurA N-terminal domain-containing protein [Paludibacteraceae bacterium]|nr:SurA N-terminal domain-containing protein [Paludibacteraceae bacterium]
MATLQKIRNHGVALIVIVGLAMLAFILGDFLNSGSSFFNRSREYVGEIEGHKVHYTEYEAAKEQLTEVYKIESGRTDLDEDLSAQIRNQVWQMMLMDWTLRAEAERIGMDVTADELSELCIGQHPHQLIAQRRAFYDENGQFNRDNLLRFLNSIEQEDDAQNANLQQAKTYWMYWENAVRLTHMQEKFSGLMQNLVTANKLDAKYAFEARQNSVSADFVVQPFHTIADSLVTVSNNDLKKLYESRKPLYKQTPNRSIEYITYPVVPSEQDSLQTYDLMIQLRDEFTTTEDIALVVNTNSDLMYDGRNYSEESIPEMFREFAFGKNAKAGDVTELIYTPEDQTFRMARLMECGYDVPDSVELKIIAAEEGQEDRELGWFSEDVLRIQNRQVAEKAFAGKRGDRFTVAMGLGEQTFEILDIAKATPKAKVAILERKVTPSSKTYSIIYNNAKQFIVNNGTEDKFRAAAQEAHMTIYPAYNLSENSDKVGQLKNSRPIVRWAFEAKEGQVSDVYECGDQFVVALLTDVKDGDFRPMSDVQGELTQMVRNEKKAALISKELAKATTIEEAAKAANTGVQHADNVTLSSNRFGNMTEPALVGAALALNANELSAPIKGNQGVYVVRPGQKTRLEGEFNAEQEINQLNMYTSYSLMYQVMNLLEENAEVTDNRARFQ